MQSTKSGNQSVTPPKDHSISSLSRTPDYSGASKIWEMHAGPINGIQSSPLSHVAVTCGQDATLRCWDMLKGEVSYSRKFSTAARTLIWFADHSCDVNVFFRAPVAMDQQQRTVLVGFEDGVVRTLVRFESGCVCYHSISGKRMAFCCSMPSSRMHLQLFSWPFLQVSCYFPVGL